jgi:hypothetical protein
MKGVIVTFWVEFSVKKTNYLKIENIKPIEK